MSEDNKPWEREPNRLDFEADGLRCEMLRNSLGVWCGYVGIGQDHPWFGLPYNTLIIPTPDMLGNRSLNDLGVIDLLMSVMSDKDPRDGIEISLALRVHGGITFSDFWDDGLFYYGFDCGHGGDLIPAMRQLGGVYRDQQYVVSECQQLATQLVKIAAHFCANVK